MDATNFKAVAHFVKRLNARSAKTNYDIKNLTDKDLDNLIDRLEGELSPENLHCDGEISNAEAQKKYVFFKRVERELEQVYYCEYPE